MKLRTVTILLLATAIQACDRTPTETVQRAANATSNELVNASQQLMKPVDTASQKALDDIYAGHVKREAARKAKIAADRESRAPKAYRWQDDAGTWHLSDRPPEGYTAEVIRLD